MEGEHFLDGCVDHDGLAKFTHGEVTLDGMPPNAAGSNFSRHAACSACKELRDYQRGFQKGGREQDDTFLPPESARLKTVKDVAPDRRPSQILQQCPECGTYYLYSSEYEFLISGSEEEQTLTRLSDSEAAALLERS